ncbi:MAG: radical SAM protein [Candidatus Omnitrophota bacterium]|nr:radical SAM protein [Candidatus Omnitrophota bacterium]
MNIVLVEVSPDKSVLTLDYLPHPGLAYIAAVLEKAGHPVRIVDPVSSGNDVNKIISQIIGFKPAIVGFTSTTSARFATISAIQMVKKECGAFVVAGGPHFHPTAKDALLLVPEIDCIVKGEGEMAMLEIARSVEAGAGLKEIPGIYFRENGGITENPDRELNDALDSLPIPAYHLFDLPRYKMRVRGTSIPAIGVISSRGCPNQCTFCSMTGLQKHRFRKRSPDLVLDEVERLHEIYGYKGFMFNDDTLTMDRGHIDAICRGIIKRKLDIAWSALARVNTVDRDILSLMKKAGCRHITYGVESGSAKTLKSIKKNITVDQARIAVAMTAELGIPFDTLFILSLPGETMEEAAKTVDLINEFARLPRGKAIYAFTFIYPGTEVERQAFDQGILPYDFSWNTEYKKVIYTVLGTDPGIPCWETPELPLRDLKALIFKSRPLSVKFSQIFHKLMDLRGRRLFSAIKIFCRAFTVKSTGHEKRGLKNGQSN